MATALDWTVDQVELVVAVVAAAVVAPVVGAVALVVAIAGSAAVSAALVGCTAGQREILSGSMLTVEGPVIVEAVVDSAVTGIVVPVAACGSAEALVAGAVAVAESWDTFAEEMVN